MTQEEKARRYDEAIEISKKWRNAPNVNKIPTFANRVIEEIFPELKESEDERIREKLIDTFNFYDPAMNSPFLLGIDKKDIIAWLEKQGKSSDQIHYWTEEEIEPIISDYLRGTEHYGGMIGRLRCLKPKFLEKQGDTSKEVICAQEAEVGNGNIKALVTEKIPIDRVEPKFRGGNWITDGRYTKLIVGINSDWPYYMFKNETPKPIKEIDKKYHLWNISDAKDGDVFATKWGAFIVKEYLDIINPDGVIAYCGINSMGKFDKCDGIYPWTDEKITPATNEQCELLFKKMKEAGYEWDADKKELNKIEQKSTEWYEKTKGLNELETYILSIVPNRPLDAVKVDSKNIRFLINKEQRLWSEEDKNFMYDTLSNLTELKDRYGEGYGNVGKCIGWLKSLKDRYAWKPSEEQLDALQYVYRNSNPLPSDKLGWNSLKTLELMYHDLKKLKG